MQEPSSGQAHQTSFAFAARALEQEVEQEVAVEAIIIQIGQRQELLEELVVEEVEVDIIKFH